MVMQTKRLNTSLTLKIILSNDDYSLICKNAIQLCVANNLSENWYF